MPIKSKPRVPLADNIDLILAVGSSLALLLLIGKLLIGYPVTF